MSARRAIALLLVAAALGLSAARVHAQDVSPPAHVSGWQSAGWAL